MTRTLICCMFALCLGFVSGCGGGGETEVVDTGAITPEQVQAEADAYEAEMANTEVRTDE